MRRPTYTEALLPDHAQMWMSEDVRLGVTHENKTCQERGPKDIILCSRRVPSFTKTSYNILLYIQSIDQALSSVMAHRRSAQQFMIDSASSINLRYPQKRSNARFPRTDNGMTDP